jgi:spore maturation protein CgeB
MNLNIVFFGLSITSSWGNGHATTYRALIKALAAQGHKVTFLERDLPWYRDHRDLRTTSYCRIALYKELKEVPRRFYRLVSEADLVVIGSYVPDGSVLADWITTHARGVKAFYDIDTPVTLAHLEAGRLDYLNAAIIPRFDLYLSFTGGPVLNLIEEVYGSPRARALHCAIDPQIHAPLHVPLKWNLGYLGTYSKDRQHTVERLLVEPARAMPQNRFVVGGPQYPAVIEWPANVDRVEHLPPAAHPEFYCGQRYTLNVTRADMVIAGFSPSVRLFEAAACGVPVITDRWPGIETFFEPGEEILIAETPRDVIHYVSELPEEVRLNLAAAARKRVLRCHTAGQRAKQLEEYYREATVSARVSPRLKSAAAAMA